MIRASFTKALGGAVLLLAQGPSLEAQQGGSPPVHVERASVQTHGVSVLQGQLPAIDPGDPAATLGGRRSSAPRGGGGWVVPQAQALFGTGAPPPDQEGLYDLTLDDTGTPWAEDFLLYVPGIPAPAEVPLLVVFHQGNSSHLDTQVNTTYIEEAEARGWYLLAPLGATQINFSSIDSQVNTKLVLDWGLANYNIDLDRIYGVGFSMGGGNALNYASRHLDPDGAMFAAIANHTGTASLTGTFAADQGSREFLRILFDGEPVEGERLFEYQRSSVLDLDANGQLVSDRNMAVNLAHVPVQTWYATNDPVDYLLPQSVALDGYLAGIGADHTLLVIPWVAHNWWILKETAVCNWLDAQVLTIPDGGSALVDRDGPYHWFTLAQDAGGSFTTFDWQVDTAGNGLELTQTTNLARATLRTVEAGLDPAEALQVTLEAADGAADTVELGGYGVAPSAVLRDGVVDGGVWNWLPGVGAVELVEADPGSHVWTIQP